MLLSYLREYDARLQWPQHEQWSKVDISQIWQEHGRLPTLYSPYLHLFICLEAFFLSNGVSKFSDKSHDSNTVINVLYCIISVSLAADWA